MSLSLILEDFCNNADHISPKLAYPDNTLSQNFFSTDEPSNTLPHKGGHQWKTLDPWLLPHETLSITKFLVDVLYWNSSLVMCYKLLILIMSLSITTTGTLTLALQRKQYSTFHQCIIKSAKTVLEICKLG